MESPSLLQRIAAQAQAEGRSAHIADISGEFLQPETLNKLRQLDPQSLSLVSGEPRLGACVGKVG